MQVHRTGLMQERGLVSPTTDASGQEVYRQHVQGTSARRTIRASPSSRRHPDR